MKIREVVGEAYVLGTRRSGRRMPEEKMPAAGLAVPYAAPNVERTMAKAHPMAPKKL